MKLDIYENKKIVKTYEASEYDLMFGTLEDVAEAVKIDELQTGSDVEIIKLVGKAVMTSMDTVKGFLMDIFDGITEDEIRRAKVSDIAVVLLDVVKYTILRLRSLNSKN